MSEPLTRDEWHDRWKVAVHRLHFEEHVPAWRATKLAYKETVVRYGPEPPKPPEPARPPLWIRMSAVFGGKGETLMGIWNWLNGKKTAIGAVLVAIPVVWNGIQPVLEAGGASPEKIAAIGGVVLGIVGVGHKLLKVFGVGLPKE